MSHNRISTLAAGLTALATMAMAAAPPALAQAWPSRHVTMVVPFAAGSASDGLGRLLAARMSEILGQQVIVENVGGAGGMVGVARVARSEPDGYQFVLGGTDTLAQNQTLYRTPQYNALTDFVPVALVGDQALMLVIRKDLPVNDLKEMTAYAKANFAKMQFASSGLGSASHLTCAQLTKWMDADVVHVSYRGSGPALQDMIAGRIDYFCSLAASAMPHIDSKVLRTIAVMSKTKSPFVPDVKTAQEQGLPDMDSYFWSMAAYPKGTPREFVTKLAQVIDQTLDTPVIQERLKTIAVVPQPKDKRSPEYAQKFVEAEVAKWATIIKASGIVLN